MYVFTRLARSCAPIVLFFFWIAACTSGKTAESIPNTAQNAQSPLSQTGATATALAAAPASQGLDPACLVGRWEVADLQRAIADSYAQSQSPLQLSSVEGQTLYQFDDVGGLTMTFNDLIATLTGQVDGQPIEARNRMNGMATAQYRVDVMSREVVLSGFGGDGIHFSVEINGQLLAEGNFPAWRAFSSNLAGGSPTLPTAGPTRVVSESHAAVSCSGGQLTLQVIDPIPGPEVNLRRLE